jgi:hypothetical protein
MKLDTPDGVSLSRARITPRISFTRAAALVARKAGIDVMTLGAETAGHDFLKSIVTRGDLVRQVSSVNLQIGITQTARLLISPRTRLVLPV